MPCFVAGSENRLAATAVEQLLQWPESLRNGQECARRPFSPLVLVGPTGSGKTHLARGVADRLRNLLPAGSVASMSVVEFGRHWEQAREEEKLDQLRTSLRRLELLVLEDFHRIRPRAAVQYELRETVDALVERGAVVLVTSQEPLVSIRSLTPDLRDRLTSGLTVRLRPPSTAARRDILQLAAAARGVPLDEETARQTAEHLEGPVPRLFRAVAELDPAIAETVRRPREPLSLRQIVAVVARYFSVSQANLRGPSRRRSVVHARSVAVYLTRTLTGLSYSQIGQGLGGRDHTTTMHADRRIREQLANDPSIQESIEDLRRILTAH